MVFILIASYAKAPVALTPNYPTAPAPSSKPVDALSARSSSPGKPDMPDITDVDIARADMSHEGHAFSNLPAGHYAGSFKPHYARPMPAVHGWDESELEEDLWTRILSRGGIDSRARLAVEAYIKSRIAFAIAVPKGEASTDSRALWMKARLELGEVLDGDTIRAMFAYMTDFQFIGTAARSIGLTWTSKPRLGMVASLDHTTHFYPLPPAFDPTRPVLHVMETGIADAASGRGVVRGLLYTENGEVLASTLQEGVVRPNFGSSSKRTERAKL